MLKKIGFLAILTGILLFLQPNLFKKMFASDNDTILLDENDLKNAATRGEEITQYADGYSEDDFGDVFKSPSDGKFPIEDEYSPVGAWEDLLKLKFAIRYDESVDDVIYQPKFTKKILSYENKTIEIEGFIIPHNIAADAMGNMDDNGAQFMFSAFPLASCFFCGGAGAESVMDATPKKPINYTERKVKLRGTLVFNDEDYLKLPYLLKDAVIIEDDL